MSNVNWTTLIVTSVIMILIGILFMSLDTKSTITKCYDRYGNEIIGQVCKTAGFSETEKLMGEIMFLSAGLIPLIAGLIIEIKERRKNENRRSDNKWRMCLFKKRQIRLA